MLSAMISGGAVVGDHRAVGEGQIGRRLVAGAVGIDPHQRRRGRCGAAVDRSVVEAGRGRSRSSRRRPARWRATTMSLALPVAQGVSSPWRTSGAVGLAAEDGPVQAGVDEEAAVGQPAQAGRLAVELDLGAPVALGRDGEDAVIEEVRVPQATVVPAGTLAEVAAPRRTARRPRMWMGMAQTSPGPPGPVPQFTTSARRPRPSPRRPSPRLAAPLTAAQGVSGLRWARDVLGAQGDPQPDLLRAVEDQGGGPGEHPQVGPGRAGRQPPVLLRFVLHPARR